MVTPTPTPRPSMAPQGDRCARHSFRGLACFPPPKVCSGQSRRMGSGCALGYMTMVGDMAWVLARDAQGA